jgi:hypothetical protein
MTKDLLVADIVSRIPDMAKDSPENNIVLLSGLIGNFQKEVEDAMSNCEELTGSPVWHVKVPLKT